MKARIPIYCRTCELLALACIDTSPICEKCLFKLMDKEEDSDIFKRIRPLDPIERRLSRARPMSYRVQD